MSLKVASIAGLPGVPITNRGVRDWLKRLEIPIEEQGNRFAFNLSDLPEPVRLAYTERQIVASGLACGTYDDAGQAAFCAACPSMRAKAERKAEIARFLVTAGKALTWPQKVALVAQKFGPEGASKPNLTRLLKAVEGVDPINFAPALLPGHKGSNRTANMSPEAWGYFMTTLRDAGEGFPLIQAWRDVRDVAIKRGWQWPSRATVWRHWEALQPAQRLHARRGRSDAIKALAQPAMRDKTTISALEWVSLDGRTLDFWVDFGDGRAVRPVMLALVDVASNKVLDFSLVKSENATDTVKLIRRTCKTYGIFDRLYPDNGSAFASHLVAGGNVHKFRNSGSKAEGVKPLGICYHLGIDLHFALPGNGQAKIAERTFATLSRVIDDRPEFKGAHAGHAPGAAPDSRVVPVTVEQAEAVLRREVDRHNSEAGRQSHGARGRSYQAVFEAGLATRTKRVMTKWQGYLAGLIYTPVAVDRWGRVTVDKWTYGQPETQADLLPFHKSGAKVLLGRDPDDFSADCIAFDEDGRLICEGIAHVKAGAYDSKEGIRDAARYRKAARDATDRAAELNGYLSDADFKAALADLGTPQTPVMPAEKVVAARFGSPLQKPRAKGKAATDFKAIPADMWRNMDALTAPKARGE